MRALTLLAWAALYCLPGGLRWRYNRGAWLEDFNRASEQMWPFEDVAAFEERRWFLSEIHKGYKGFEMPKTDEEAEELWRHPMAGNLLFSTVGRREAQPLRFLRYMRHLPWSGRVLEFAAGAAPLAYGLSQAWPFPAPTITIADIDWPLLWYHRKRVRYTNVKDEMQWPVDSILQVRHIPTFLRAGIGPWDGIVATECLEHVPDPPKTARQLVSWLKPGGVLLYDYGHQSKDQPYAPRGMSARSETLGYLAGALITKGPDKRGLYVGRKPR